MNRHAANVTADQALVAAAHDRYALALAGEALHLARQHGFRHPGVAFDDCFEQGNAAGVIGHLVRLGMEDGEVRADLLRAHAYMPPVVTLALSAWELGHTDGAAPSWRYPILAPLPDHHLFDARTRARLLLRQLDRFTA